MIGQLDQAIVQLLVAELPALFGGGSPAVTVSVGSELFTIDPASADPEASQPRTDDRTDHLPFDAAHPDGPYTLTQPPDSSVRKVRLTTPQGDRIALTDSEVIFDPVDATHFTLHLRSGRELSAVNGVEVLYGVTAVFTKVKYSADLTVALQSANAAATERASTLAAGVIALNLPQLVSGGGSTDSQARYDVQISVKSLKLASGSAPAAGGRHIVLSATFEMKANRALAADEGQAIARIRTNSEPLDPSRPVNIRINVEA